MLRKATDIQGYRLEARDGTIGKCRDLLFDDESWTVRYLVADTGKWLPGRRVLLAPAAVILGALHDNKLPLDLTKNQIEHSPGIEEDRPVSEQQQLDLHAYYGWPSYWGVAPYPMAGVMAPVGPLMGPGPSQLPEDEVRKSEGDPHLRSVRHVTGYHLQASDGPIGHVEDFLIKVDGWKVQGLVVDTRNWLPGKKVVVPPELVNRVSWTDSEVAVHLTRESVKNSPEYAPDVELSDDFSEMLARYYEEFTPVAR